MSEHATGDVIYSGRLITVRRQPVAQPDGSVAQYEMVDHPDAAAVVAVRPDDTGGAEPLVALVRQPRPAIDRDTWEIPAGLIADHDGNDTEAAARRELLEETGFECDSLMFLNRHYPSPGFCNEAISIYLATGLREAEGQPAPDPTEISQLDWKPLDEAMRMCREGIIEDGKTIIGLWLARDALAE